MPSGADLAYARMLKEAGLNNGAGQDGASLALKGAVMTSPRLRRIANHRPLSSKVPTTKAQVSITANAFDGYNFGNIVKIDELLDKADCNYVKDNLYQFGAPYYWKGNYSGPRNTDGSTDNLLVKPYDHTFMFEGTYLGVGYNFLTNFWNPQARIWIDDEEIPSWYLGARAANQLQNNNIVSGASLAAGYHVININFAARGTYKIRVAGPMATGGSAAGTDIGNYLFLSTNSYIYKPSARPVVATIGDSYLEAISSQTSLPGTVVLGTELNAKIYNACQGGSGFYNPGLGLPALGQKQYGSDQVMAALKSFGKLDLIIANGSGNDLLYSDDRVAEAMRNCFSRLAIEQPGVPIIWVGLEPVNYFKTLYNYNTVIKPREQLLKRVAESCDNVIGTVLPCAEDWLQGTGRVGAPVGDGNQDFNIGADAIHGEATGNNHYWKLAAERIKGILVAGGSA